MGDSAEGKARRYERWIGIVGASLKPPWKVQTFYEDHQGGNLLVLSAESPDGLVELHVHRATRGATPTGVPAPDAEKTKAVSATLVLMAETKAAISSFSEAIAGTHNRVPRTQNAKRKFVHRVEELASHLARTFDLRGAEYPEQDLARHRTWLGGARPMTGIQTGFRQSRKEQEEGASWWDPSKWFEDHDKTMAREARRFPTRFGARVQAKGRSRAALYHNGAFALGGVALTAAVMGALAAGAGVQRAPQPAEEEEESSLEALDALDVAEFAYDAGDIAGEAVGGAGDCGGLDMPDCDMPDCGGIDVPDCGGLDCG